MNEITTRSQWLGETSPLDDIFEDPKEVNEFVDELYALPDFVMESDESVALARKLAKGEPDSVIAPKPLTQDVTRFIRIIHGYHGSDYVWHIEPASIRRPWRIPENQVLYLVAKTMHDNLPEIEAKLWLPESSWELRTITFKAMGLRDHWGFREGLISQINNRLFEVLNTIV